METEVLETDSWQAGQKFTGVWACECLPVAHICSSLLIIYAADCCIHSCILYEGQKFIWLDIFCQQTQPLSQSDTCDRWRYHKVRLILPVRFNLNIVYYDATGSSVLQLCNWWYFTGSKKPLLLSVWLVFSCMCFITDRTINLLIDWSIFIYWWSLQRSALPDSFVFVQPHWNLSLWTCLTEHDRVMQSCLLKLCQHSLYEWLNEI